MSTQMSDAQLRLERDKLELAQSEFRHRVDMDMAKLNADKIAASNASFADKDKSENAGKMKDEITALKETISVLVTEVREMKEALAKFMGTNKVESADNNKSAKSEDSRREALLSRSEDSRYEALLSRFEAMEKRRALARFNSWGDDAGSAPATLPPTAAATTAATVSRRCE